MKRLKGLTLAFACGLALAASTAGFAQNNPQSDKGKKAESCCATKEGKEGCCKGDSCCKSESCCCKGGSCPMHPHGSKKTGQR